MSTPYVSADRKELITLESGAPLEPASLIPYDDGPGGPGGPTGPVAVDPTERSPLIVEGSMEGPNGTTANFSISEKGWCEIASRGGYAFATILPGTFDALVNAIGDINGSGSSSGAHASASVVLNLVCEIIGGGSINGIINFQFGGDSIKAAVRKGKVTQCSGSKTGEIALAAGFTLIGIPQVIAQSVEGFQQFGTGACVAVAGINSLAFLTTRGLSVSEKMEQLFAYFRTREFARRMAEVDALENSQYKIYRENIKTFISEHFDDYEVREIALAFLKVRTPDTRSWGRYLADKGTYISGAIVSATIFGNLNKYFYRSFMGDAAATVCGYISALPSILFWGEGFEKALVRLPLVPSVVTELYHFLEARMPPVAAAVLTTTLIGGATFLVGYSGSFLQAGVRLAVGAGWGGDAASGFLMDAIWWGATSFINASLTMRFFEESKGEELISAEKLTEVIKELDKSGLVDSKLLERVARALQCTDVWAETYVEENYTSRGKAHIPPAERYTHFISPVVTDPAATPDATPAASPSGTSRSLVV